MPVSKHMNLEEAMAGVVEWIGLWNANVARLEKGRTLKLVAGEALTERLAFYIHATTGKAWKATASTSVDGIWESASTAAEATGLGQVGGVFTYDSWSWSVSGATIYVTAGGVLTESVTATIIGRALSLTEIKLEPGGTLGAHSHVETDISDGSLLARVADAETISGIWRFDANTGFNTATFGTSFAGGIAMKNGTANTTDVGDQFHFYAADVSSLSTPHFRTEGGDIIKLYKEAALTAEDGATVDGTYGTEEQGVINNLRTRMGELETALQAIGLIT